MPVFVAFEQCEQKKTCKNSRVGKEEEKEIVRVYARLLFILNEWMALKLNTGKCKLMYKLCIDCNIQHNHFRPSNFSDFKINILKICIIKVKNKKKIEARAFENLN